MRCPFAGTGILRELDDLLEHVEKRLLAERREPAVLGPQLQRGEKAEVDRLQVERHASPVEGRDERERRERSARVGDGHEARGSTLADLRAPTKCFDP